MARCNRARAVKLRNTAAGLADAKCAKKLLEQAEEYDEIAEGYETLVRQPRRKA